MISNRYGVIIGVLPCWYIGIHALMPSLHADDRFIVIEWHIISGGWDPQELRRLMRSDASVNSLLMVFNNYPH